MGSAVGQVPEYVEMGDALVQDNIAACRSS